MAGKTKRPKLSDEEKLRRKHYGAARAIFRNAGFTRVAQASDKEFMFSGQAGDFDDVYIYENVIILLEYTISSISKVGDHLKKKKILFSKINSDPLAFVKFYRDKFSDVNAVLSDTYHWDKYVVRMVYCSYNEPSPSIKANVDEVVYLDFPYLKYFEKISDTIKLSARHELFQFLGINPLQVGDDGKFPKKGAAEAYHGSILPESSSGFPDGYKVVSFYADAAALLSRAYVLRRDGWRGSFESYQRMLQKTKIDEIRKKLRRKPQVFVNNLIATLPSNVHPVDIDGKTVDIKTLTETEPVTLSLPAMPNSIGIIDGQHRLFSYHETKIDDPTIAKLRNQQNLLVTGIIYPEKIPNSVRERFEASLFLNINSNQTNAPRALRQEIDVLLNPFSSDSIAKQVMHKLAGDGPLSGHVERYFYDENLLKTTSIVSYGLAPLVKLAGEDSLFSTLDKSDQEAISNDNDEYALAKYVDMAKSQINIILSAVRANVSSSRWTVDKKVHDRILTVTYVNSFLIVLRNLIRDKQKRDFVTLKDKLSGIDKFDFKKFHSSQYNRMANEIYKAHF